MFKEYSKMTKKEQKEYNKKNRVSFSMNLGTITHKSKKHPSRAEMKSFVRRHQEVM